MSTQPGAGALPDAWIRRLTIGFCLLAIVLGAVQAWTSRYEMNPDGVQYLDNADAYRTGDLPHAINSQWSPLYPWLIGASFAAVRPTLEQEFPLVHFPNLLLFLASLLGFLYFTNGVCALMAQNSTCITSLLLISYSEFLYCSLDLTNLRHVAPDLLVNLFAFIAAGLLVRMATGTATTLHYAGLGVTLGLGYLAKTPFLLYGLLCLGLAFLLARNHAQVLQRLGLAVVLWSTIAGPYIWIMSNGTGRFTTGDSGKFNIIWHVNGVPNTHWQGGPDRNGKPLHPTRQLSTHPTIFEFATPVGGTYPPWYNPIYWNDGAKIAFRPKDFASAIAKQIRLYAYLAHHRQVPLLFTLMAMILLTPAKREIFPRLEPLWAVLAFGALPFVMYAPVHAEGRYLASFFVLLWASLFFGLLAGFEKLNSRVTLAIAVTASLLMLIESITVSFPSSTIGTENPQPSRLHYEIARNLHSLGLRTGDRVAMVDGDLPYYWGRLAGARISVEISFSEDYRLRPAEWETAKKLVSSDLAAFVVAPDLAGVVDQSGWVELGNTHVFVYPIRASDASNK